MAFVCQANQLLFKQEMLMPAEYNFGLKIKLGRNALVRPSLFISFIWLPKDCELERFCFALNSAIFQT